MPKINEVRDTASDAIPGIEKLRESQLAGGRGKGTNPDDTKLNECQGHEVDLQE